LRSLARRCDPLRQTESLDDIVTETLGLVQREMADHQISPHIELNACTAQICADRVQLQQVIINLIINACQAMQATPIAERKLRVRTWVENSKAVMEVADQGSGIAADVLPSLFNPFFTTKENGLGMGLSVCRSIIDFHGGRIWANSVAGQGTSLLFALPVLIAAEPG
jgi:C4-dicarboxylate-specific signal transduction histidine kinase